MTGFKTITASTRYFATHKLVTAALTLAALVGTPPPSYADDDSAMAADWYTYLSEVAFNNVPTNNHIAANGPGVHSYTDITHVLKNSDFSQCNPAPGSYCAPADDWFRDGGFTHGVYWTAYGAFTPGAATIVAPQYPDSSMFGAFGQCFHATHLAGRAISLSASVAASNVWNGYAGLWVRADSASGQMLALDNMYGRGISGTQNYRPIGTTVVVPYGTAQICVGGLLTGTGAAYFDDFRLVK